MADGQSGQIELAIDTIKYIKIPLPHLNIQSQIVKKLEALQNEETDLLKNILKLKSEIDLVYFNYPINGKLKILSEVISLQNGKGLSSSNFVKGDYNVWGGNGITGKHNEYYIEKPIIAIGRVGAYCGSIHITTPKSWITDNSM